MNRSVTVGEFEHLVLLATLQLREEADAPGIVDLLDRQAGRRVSRGALYSCLDRLERKGLIGWSIAEASPERGGYRKRRFELTRAGLATVRASRAVLESFWEGAGDVWEESS